jgi:hypothetical protein
MKKNPFKDVDARNWLFDTVNPVSPEFHGFLFILGSMPFEQNEFATFCVKKFDLGCFTELCAIDHTGSSSHENGIRRNFITGKPDESAEEMIIVVGRDCSYTSMLESLYLQNYFVYDSQTFSGDFWFEIRVTKNKKLALLKSPGIKNISVISQEMFLSRLLRNAPIHESNADDEFLKLHIEGHTTLAQYNKIQNVIDKCSKPQLLIKKENGYFAWPSTEIGTNNQGDIGDLDESPKVGLLSNMGYHVGITGAHKSERNRILEIVYTASVLPNVDSPEYIKEWGNPASLKRLKKMADTVASSCRNAKGQTHKDMHVAINDWESDLAWLKKTFYDGVYNKKFIWPSSD